MNVEQQAEIMNAFDGVAEKLNIDEEILNAVLPKWMELLEKEVKRKKREEKKAKDIVISLDMENQNLLNHIFNNVGKTKKFVEFEGKTYRCTYDESAEAKLALMMKKIKQKYNKDRYNLFKEKKNSEQNSD
jgi:hypothetical protein